uniref:Uncharacterized protein n=1 Tax=Panagrolaimus sp. JU765 TaxID=591449 RepID=A0AC34QIB6_9BILA
MKTGIVKSVSAFILAKKDEKLVQCQKIKDEIKLLSFLNFENPKSNAADSEMDMKSEKMIGFLADEK